jgi:hypothetical protein
MSSRNRVSVEEESLAVVADATPIAADILGTLIIYLNQRASTMKRVIGQTFLLNNRESLVVPGRKRSVSCIT